MSSRSSEIAVIGGGPAGLQAAMTIGRVHRDAVVFDSGVYRNATVEHMHNVAGFDGTPPAEFRDQARAQLSAYPTVSVESASVRQVVPVGSDEEPAFEVHLHDGDVVTVRGVVLATGVRDELPAIAGIEELWGTLAAQCPFCHGHEFAGRPVAVLGGLTAPHVALWLHRIASELVVFENGEEVTEQGRAALEGVGARIVTGGVERLDRDGAGIVVTTNAGESYCAAGIFVVPTLHQRAPFATDLGLAINDSGCVRIDAFGRTSRPGVYAAGDMAHLPELPMPMASVVQSVAAGQTAATTAVREGGWRSRLDGPGRR